ncbi:MAG: NUDIX hydrolase [Thermoplasmata archaeon]
MAKFARYGPAPRYGLPEAGFCLSSFAILKDGSKVLLGRPKDHPRWEAEWAPNFTAYDPEEREVEFHSWRFPAAYLYEGEHPDEALRRVVEDQLGLKEYQAGPASIHAFYDPSDWFPGKLHYDLCFVYEVRGTLPTVLPPWFAGLEFVDASSLKAKDFGSAMGDLAAALEFIRG